MPITKLLPLLAAFEIPVIKLKSMKSVQLTSNGYLNNHDSNPQNVLESIGATGGFGASTIGELDGSSTAQGAELVDDYQAKDESVPSLRLMVVPEVDREIDLQKQRAEEDILLSTIESAKQIQQLASRLKQTQSDLAKRESSLNAAVVAHENTMRQQQHVVERHLSQLQQHTTQVRAQQRQVMQLQTAIVQSNEATKIAIEQLVSSELTDPTTLQHMKSIQHELTDRFDFISRRWKHLFDLLENQRVQLELAESPRHAA